VIQSQQWCLEKKNQNKHKNVINSGPALNEIANKEFWRIETCIQPFTMNP